jgi:hypothetical protein
MEAHSVESFRGSLSPAEINETLIIIIIFSSLLVIRDTAVQEPALPLRINGSSACLLPVVGPRMSRSITPFKQVQ